MALDKSILVDIPEHRIAYKKVAGKTYVYILLFFHDWMKYKKANEYVAYDVTSISLYSKNISELEWGYNRDKERLPRINMGMYYGEESKMPLYYRMYPGSISDKAHLKYMLCNNEFINGKRTRFVKLWADKTVI